MVTSENQKLIYQLSYMYQGGRFSGQGTIYPKNSIMPSTESNRIWAKRAFKKGYADLVEDTSEHLMYQINDKGIELLKQYENYYLHKPTSYGIYKAMKKQLNNTEEELKKQRRRERRRLRKLKQMGRTK